MTKIEEFLRAFDDQHLANLQAAAEDGKLVYFDTCSCLLHFKNGNYSVTKSMAPGAELAQKAEVEFWGLPWGGPGGKSRYQTLEQDDADRRRMMLPLIHAEWVRRLQERDEVSEYEVSCVS